MARANVYQDFLTSLSHQEPSRAPVAIWNTRSALVRVQGARRLLDYYQDVEIKLRSQLFPLDRFDDCLIIPGVWPDYGVALEASAFGSPVRWSDDNPPQAMPYMDQIADFRKMKPIDPKEDGLMPQALREYRYMLANLDRGYVERIGYLDGCAVTTGPLEVAAAMAGHTKLYVAFYDDVQLVHAFLEFITDGIISYLKALERVAGELKLVTMIEHVPGQISPEHFNEYAVPYISRIFREFPGAIKLYHNEDNLSHILGDLPKLGADIWHFGDVDPAQAKAAVGSALTLLGNLHPLRVLLEGTPDQVNAKAKECIASLAPGGGFVLCSGGGLAPGTPLDNVAAMITAARG
ncbi:MAG: uroporphyrinogen decarboxylase family protein [Limnochordia bacterium]|nr:hypothetical protein [Bacillota bacterium]